MSNIKQSRIDEILSKRYVSYDKCDNGIHVWNVKGSKDNQYIITHDHGNDTGTNQAWTCECPSFTHDETHWIAECKHICAVKQYMIKNNDVGYSFEDEEAMAQAL